MSHARQDATAAVALAGAIAQLRAAGVPDPARDARLLLAHAAGIEAHRVSVIAPDPLPEAVLERFRDLVARRAGRAPVSHLTGRREFYGRSFVVGPDVLDPRPETEILIEVALAEPFARVLDLGTGSGAILATLLAEAPQAAGVGTDVSEAACLVASGNLARLGLAGRAEIILSDWFAGVIGRFDLIVSNPPYLSRAEMAAAPPELLHEPRAALTDEGDGLAAYRAIARGAGEHIAPGGRLILEIGHRQREAVCDILRHAGWQIASVLPDLDGRDRVVVARPREAR